MPLPTQHFRSVATDPAGRSFVLELSDASFLPLVDHAIGALVFARLRRRPKWAALVTNVDGDRLREQRFATFEEGRAWLRSIATTIEAGELR